MLCVATDRRLLPLLLFALAACGDSTAGTVTEGHDTHDHTTGTSSTSEGTTAGPTTTTTGTTDPDTTTGTTDPSTSSGSTSGGKLDVGPPPPNEECKVPEDELDAIPECQMSSPPDIFAPEIQWEWWGEEGEDQSITTPLVANLTDDDENGEIDLCDVPDVVVLAATSVVGDTPAHLYVLDGETGLMHWSSEVDLDPSCNPALGDLDGDGIPEIVAARNDDGLLVAFEHDGTVAWTGEHGFPPGSALGSIAIADLDQDGTPEIIGLNFVTDNEGKLLFEADGNHFSFSPTAADLDGEPGLEAVWGGYAAHADGTPYIPAGSLPGFTAVVDIDDDPEPEIVNTSFDGITILEHDGSFKWNGKPVDVEDLDAYIRPHAIHDFDDDGKPEMAMSNQSLFSVMEFEDDGMSVTWSSPVLDDSGSAGGTAFDFNKDGKAEAMYADETNLFIWDGEDPSEPLLEWTRLSRTLFEYPVVADVDNDGASEIVVVSNECIDDPCGEPSPTVIVLRDAEDRWAQSRRIWNQHSYHVTNVREDGTIPIEETPSWTQLNTFRTNATIEGGGVCTPPQ